MLEIYILFHCTFAEVKYILFLLSLLQKKLMSRPKPWIHKRSKYALFVEYSKDSRHLIVEAIGTRFLQSFHLLTKIPQDLYEALFPFTRMISGLGSRGNLSLMPQLDHLIFWSEFYLSLTWMFISKASKRILNKHFTLWIKCTCQSPVIRSCTPY